ncbi:AAA family ATPase [Pigmentiphaga aceris]|uniref:AAA family ATPase n=1 Tax=Pigmentiphaga aceris TaxID=1940612 RepID=UPI001652A0FE|nr:AAA family ATPase [Pigmentiphaga aceris]
MRQEWDISDPQSIIVFLDAGKAFSDFGVSFENVALRSRAQKAKEFILECIFNPDEALQSIYKKTVLDHVQYRLDPSRKYEYFKNANEAVRIISRNIEVKNISATKKDGQLVMLGRTSSESAMFDVKDFSAGERSLYLTLLFLFYLPNIGILIIDEPENHLHESLLVSFYSFLREVMGAGGVSNWLASKQGVKHAEHRSSAIDQIFLITHSKPLIYQNISFGECLVFSDGELKPIYSSGIERELRFAGITTVFSRVLFVEGKGDVEILADVLAAHRIEVVPLSSCKEVIDYFRKIANIKGSLHASSYCFAIDKDNRSAQDLAEIRSYDPEFYDDSFVVLERHEMENYLIDKKLIMDSINPALQALGVKQHSVASLNKLFSDQAESLRGQSKAKYLASVFKMKLKEMILDPLTNVRSLQSSVSETLESVFDSDLAHHMQLESLSAESIFDEEWVKGWEALVDGKAFIGKILVQLSQSSGGIKTEIIRKKMVAQLIGSPASYDAGVLVDTIVEKIQGQEHYIKRV